MEVLLLGLYLKLPNLLHQRTRKLACVNLSCHDSGLWESRTRVHKRPFSHCSLTSLISANSFSHQLSVTFSPFSLDIGDCLSPFNDHLVKLRPIFRISVTKVKSTKNSQPVEILTLSLDPLNHIGPLSSLHIRNVFRQNAPWTRPGAMAVR